MKKIIKNTKFKLESAVIALGTLFITDPVLLQSFKSTIK